MDIHYQNIPFEFRILVFFTDDNDDGKQTYDEIERNMLIVNSDMYIFIFNQLADHD